MPRGQTVSPETRALVEADLREALLTRNAVARKHGVSGAWVSGFAHDLGIEFDKSKTELAVAAHALDLAAWRGEIAKKIAAEVTRSVEDMHSPITVTQWVNATEHQSGGWKSKTFVEPNASDRRNLMTIAGIGITKIAELTRTAQTEGAPEAIAFVETLQAGLDGVRQFLDKGGDLGDHDPTKEPAPTTRDEMLADFADGEESTERGPE